MVLSVKQENRTKFNLQETEVVVYACFRVSEKQTEIACYAISKLSAIAKRKDRGLCRLVADKINAVLFLLSLQ
jgi:hypothetical protein